MHPQRPLSVASSSSRPVPPRGSITFPNSVSGWGPLVQRHVHMGLSFKVPS